VRWLLAAAVAGGAVACGGGGTPAGREASPAAPPTSQAEASAAHSPVPHESCTQEMAVPIKAVAWHDMKWKDNGGRGEGNDPHVVLAVPEAGAICGVRLRFTLTTTDGKPAFFQVFWRPRGGNFGEDHQTSAPLASGPAEQTFTAWVDGPIDALRIDPDARPVDFKLGGVALLKPADAHP